MGDVDVSDERIAQCVRAVRDWCGRCGFDREVRWDVGWTMRMMAMLKC